MFNGIPRCRKIKEDWNIRKSMRSRRRKVGRKGVKQDYEPESTLLSTVKPSLHTFWCVSVTVFDIPWRVNSSLM